MSVIDRRAHLSVGATVTGLALLCYVGGAAVMHYRLPSSAWLTNAFLGARASRAYQVALSQPPRESRQRPATARADVDEPHETCDGFTFYTCVADKRLGRLGTEAFLVNMRREVVHHWSIPFSEIRPGPAHDASVCFFGTYLYPNGDLLAVCGGTTPSDCGLAKIDAASKLLWFYPGAIHHDVDVAEDGTIYAVQDEQCHAAPECIQGLAAPYMVDSLVALSPEGKLLREPMSILSALCDSPYAALLATLEEPDKSLKQPFGSTAPQITWRPTPFGVNDAMHTNCVRVLPGDVAAKFPMFRAGQILVSLRTPSVLAVLDPVQRRAVWAARGPWLAQHDPQFLDNGHLLIFDNLGSPRGSRVLEYDPQTQAVPWSYGGSAGNRIYSSERGMNQRLPNGNTFMVLSEAGSMIEVTAGGEPVWSYSLGGFVASARRYLPRQLLFLPHGTAARP